MLDGSELGVASAQGVDLSHASLRSTDLHGANLESVLPLSPSRVCAHWGVRVGTRALTRLQATFVGADVDGLVLVNGGLSANLRGASFLGARNMHTAKFANLPEAMLKQILGLFAWSPRPPPPPGVR